jgi:hypothetical protein
MLVRGSIGAAEEKKFIAGEKRWWLGERDVRLRQVGGGRQGQRAKSFILLGKKSDLLSAGYTLRHINTGRDSRQAAARCSIVEFSLVSSFSWQRLALRSR